MTGCATRLGADDVRRHRRARDGRARERGGGRRAHRARARRDRLRRPGAAAGAHARVRQGAGRLHVRLLLLRDSARARRRAARDRSAPCSTRRAGASPRVTASWSSRASTSVSTAMRRRGARLPEVLVRAGRARRRRARAALVDRGQPPRARGSARRSRTRASARICTSRCSPATTACCSAMRRRYDLATYARRVERAREHVPGLNLTGDVIVGFPAEDGAGLRAHARRRRAARVLAPARVPVLAAAGHAHGRMPTRSRAAVKRRRAERLRALSDRLGHAHRAARVGQRDRVLIERVGADGALHGYGADYTAYELRAQCRRRGRRPRRGRAGGRRASGLHWGGSRDRSHRQGRQDAP